MITQQMMLDIHHAIHTGQTNVEIDGKKYPVTRSSTNGCKKVSIGNITFMEQDRRKTSLWAHKARNGDLITWGIRRGKWIYIENNKVFL